MSFLALISLALVLFLEFLNPSSALAIERLIYKRHGELYSSFFSHPSVEMQRRGNYCRFVLSSARATNSFDVRFAARALLPLDAYVSALNERRDFRELLDDDAPSGPSSQRLMEIETFMLPLLIDPLRRTSSVPTSSRDVYIEGPEAIRDSEDLDPYRWHSILSELMGVDLKKADSLSESLAWGFQPRELVDLLGDLTGDLRFGMHPTQSFYLTYRETRAATLLARTFWRAGEAAWDVLDDQIRSGLDSLNYLQLATAIELSFPRSTGRLIHSIIEKLLDEDVRVRFAALHALMAIHRSDMEIPIAEYNGQKGKLTQRETDSKMSIQDNHVADIEATLQRMSNELGGRVPGQTDALPSDPKEQIQEILFLLFRVRTEVDVSRGGYRLYVKLRGAHPQELLEAYGQLQMRLRRDLYGLRFFVNHDLNQVGRTLD